MFTGSSDITSVIIEALILSAEVFGNGICVNRVSWSTVNYLNTCRFVFTININEIVLSNTENKVQSYKHNNIAWAMS